MVNEHNEHHAVQDRHLVEKGQQWRSEVVAELGGAVLLECQGFKAESDHGGGEYVVTYAKEAAIEPFNACTQVIERTCQAVAQVLEEAQKLAKSDAQCIDTTREILHAF